MVVGRTEDKQTSMPLHFSLCDISTFAAACDWLVTESGLHFLCVVVLLLVIGLLLNHISGEQCRRDDYILQHEHATSDKMKQKRLANMELESGKFKQKQELLVVNRRLKEQLHQQDVLIDKLTKKKEKLHTSVKEVSDSRNEYHDRSHALILELKDMDGQLEEKQKMASELQDNLTEKQNESRRLKKKTNL